MPILAEYEGVTALARAGCPGELQTITERAVTNAARHSAYERLAIAYALAPENSLYCPRATEGLLANDLEVRFDLRADQLSNHLVNAEEIGVILAAAPEDERNIALRKVMERLAEIPDFWVDFEIGRSH